MPSGEVSTGEISGVFGAIRLVRHAVSGVGFGGSVPYKGAESGGEALA